MNTGAIISSARARRGRDREPKGCRCFKVQDEFDSGRLLSWQIGRVRSYKILSTLRLAAPMRVGIGQALLDQRDELVLPHALAPAR